MSRKDGKDDLKNMLNSFRIAELQTLLASCGRSRSGRKHELHGRALSLLRSSEGSPLRERVRSKILELYHQRCSTSYVGSSNSGSISSGNIPNSSYSSSYHSYPNEKEDTPQYMKRHYKLVPQQRSNNYSMQEPRMHMYEPRSIHPVNAMPIHPDVSFIPLPFYDIIDVLIKPSSLVQKTVTGFQETTLVCHLSPYQTQLITNSRSFNVKSMIEYTVQVQLRFCLAETSCVQEDLYPPRCKIIVNNKSCTLPGQPPPNAQNQEPRKPHRPVNITHLCRLSPMQSNQVQIQWMPSDSGQRYAATVHLVKIVPASTLIQNLRNKPERSPDHTIAFIKEKLRPDPDSEVALTSLKVSLCCPIGRTRMTMPCRANNCNHLQCFDGSLYIQMNERKPSWVCPVCDQKAHYDQLFKDGMFSNIIQKASGCDDIVFFEDGSWRPLSDIQDNSKPLSQVVNTPSRKPTNIVDCKTPPLETDAPTARDFSTPPGIPKLERCSTSTAAPSEKEKSSEVDVEVITIDDSDSEDGLPNTPSPTINEPPIPANIRYPNVRYPDSSYPNHQQPSSLSFSDPDLQGLDLYNLLPHEDRIAAAMYLDQTGILSQLNARNNHTSPSGSVIDISDE